MLYNEVNKDGKGDKDNMKKQSNMKKQNKILIIVIVLFLIMAVGYALFSETLDIKGTVSAGGNFGLTYQCGEVQKNGDAVTGSCQVDENNIIVTSTFTKPAEWVEFVMKVTNSGGIPAVLKSVDSPNNALMTNPIADGDEIYLDKATFLGADYKIWRNDATGNKVGNAIYGDAAVEKAQITLQPGESITIISTHAWSDSNHFLPEQPRLPDGGASIKYDLKFNFQQVIA